MGKKLTLELKITVTYNLENGEENLLRSNLNNLPYLVAGEGLFTEDSISTVSIWHHSLKEIAQ